MPKEQTQEISTAFYNDIRNIIEESKINAIRSVDFQRVFMYWRLGERIMLEIWLVLGATEKKRAGFVIIFKQITLTASKNWVTL